MLREIKGVLIKITDLELNYVTSPGDVNPWYRSPELCYEFLKIPGDLIYGIIPFIDINNC